jgi:hypothetical protein
VTPARAVSWQFSSFNVEVIELLLFQQRILPVRSRDSAADVQLIAVYKLLCKCNELAEKCQA